MGPTFEGSFALEEGEIDAPNDKAPRSCMQD